MKPLPRRPILVTAIVISTMGSLSLVCSVLLGIANVLEPARENIYLSVLGILLLTWLVRDPNLAVENRPSFDHVYLHYATFPLLAIYEQYIARGWRGIGVLFGLLFILSARYLFGLLMVPFAN